MKILGEKSINKFSKVIKFLTICRRNKNIIRDLTDAKCKVYHIDCCYVNGNFNLCSGAWISSRKIVDALSQINQYNRGVNPYIILNCVDENANHIESFIAQKDKWIKSFKYIKIC